MGGLFEGQQIRTAGVGGVIVLHLPLANQPKEEIDAGGPSVEFTGTSPVRPT